VPYRFHSHAPLVATSHGLSRLEARFYRDRAQVGRVLEEQGPIPTERAMELGLVTLAPHGPPACALLCRTRMASDCTTGTCMAAPSITLPSGIGVCH
jgi:hypothetical protein